MHEIAHESMIFFNNIDNNTNHDSAEIYTRGAIMRQVNSRKEKSRQT